MNQIYVNLLYAAITAGVPCLIGGLFTAVNHFVGTQKTSKIINTLQTKSHLATEAVLFVEDAFTALGGPQKLESAKVNLIGRLNNCGIPVTENETDTLIRAAFQTVKSGFEAEVSKEAEVTVTA
jgi:hypothetical protein